MLYCPLALPAAYPCINAHRYINARARPKNVCICCIPVVACVHVFPGRSRARALAHSFSICWVRSIFGAYHVIEFGASPPQQRKIQIEWIIYLNDLWKSRCAQARVSANHVNVRILCICARAHMCALCVCRWGRGSSKRSRIFCTHRTQNAHSLSLLLCTKPLNKRSFCLNKQMAELLIIFVRCNHNRSITEMLILFGA